MSTARQDFESVMREHVAPHTAAMEALRRQVLGRCLLVSAALLTLGTLILVALSHAEVTGRWEIAGGVTLGLLFFLWKRQYDDYRSQFKKRMVQPLVHACDPRLVYWPTDAVAREDFEASGLFRDPPITRYSGEDLIHGTLGATAIRCSEVTARYRSLVKHRGSNDVEIFRGLFVVADFNKHFQGSTYVLPDRAQRSLGALGQMLQSLDSTYGQLVKLEDPTFERLFVVYASDQIEARYILSAALMSRISDFRMKSGHTLRLAFLRSKLYMAIHIPRNLFEPRLLRNVLQPSIYREIWDDIQLITDIVEDLNLNTRIWSKR